MDKGWRLHSAGYAVLQFTRFGRIHTIYMHKMLASEFLDKPDTEKKLFVRMKNGKKLDCRLDNFEWNTMAELRRQQKNSSGYRGVSRDGNKFRAVLYDKGERIYLGMFDTAEEAAKAYDDESVKRFGETNSLNFMQEEEMAVL
ncbi:AP2/ERF family transcription factor [Limibacter armeniacum]|uniref:AP2/ERF family transcription factor n=1 Tax=Limibacter armeniacum TaxID=466084 RepID=UPI002FE52033